MTRIELAEGMLADAELCLANQNWMGEMLNRLRRMRIAADYELQLPNEEDVARFAVQNSRRFLEEVERACL